MPLLSKVFYKKNKLIYYLSLIFVLFGFLVFALTKIDAQINTLHYKLTYLFEKELNTKVSIGKIEGDLRKELILNDVIIYHEFRSGVKLIEAKRVTIDFNLASAFLKDSIPIKNISRISVYDYEVYIDEYFTKTKALRVLIGEDDGVNNKPSFTVEIEKGRVYSIFLDKGLGQFKASNVKCVFTIAPTTFSFDGSGFVEGSKEYGNTKTNFRIKANDSLEKGKMRGVLDLESASYLGYDFKALALDFFLSGEKVKFHVKPTSYKPFLKSLKEEHLQSYSFNKYKYLLDLRFTYLINENETYIDVVAGKESHAVRNITASFLKKIKLDKYFLNKDKWKILGKAFFKLKGSDLKTVNISIKEASNMFALKDSMSLSIYSNKKRLSKPLLQFKNLEYHGAQEGLIKGDFNVSFDKKITSANLEIKRLYVKPFANIISPLKEAKEKIQSITLPTQHKIFDRESFLSTNIVLQRKHNLYTLSLYDNILSNTTLPNLIVTVKESNANILLITAKTLNYADITLNAKLNLKLLSRIPFSVDINSINYGYALKLLDITESLTTNKNNLSLSGKLRGAIYPYKIFNSVVNGQIHVYKQNNARRQKGRQKNINEEIAFLDFKYKNANIHFNKSYINYLNLGFKGIVSLKENDYYGEITLLYKGIKVYIDAHLRKEKDLYYTKLNLIYDNFKKQITSINSYIKLQKRRIAFKNATISHNKKRFKLIGFVDFGQSFIKPNLILLEKNNSVLLDINGIVSANTTKTLTKISKNLNIIYKKDSYNILGDIIFTKDNILPNIKIIKEDNNKARQELTLYGTLKRATNDIKARLKLGYNKAYFDIYSLINYKSPRFLAIDFSLFPSSENTALKKDHEIKELVPLFSFLGKIGFAEDAKDSFFFRGNANIKGNLSYIDGTLSFKGSTILTNIAFRLEGGDKAKLSGYITYRDIYYFPHLKLEFYPAIYKGKKRLQFLIEGKIVESKDSFHIDTVINKRINLKGILQKYSLIELNLFFNNYPIDIIDNLSFKIHNKYSDNKGFHIRVDSSGILLDGNLLIKELFLIEGEDDFKLDSSFYYFIPFSKEDKADNNISFNIALQKSNKVILKTKGFVSYKDDTINLSLRGLEQFKLDLLYRTSKDFSLNINLNKLNIDNISKKIKGSFTGNISLSGNVGNPTIIANDIRIDNGVFRGISFNTNFAFYKKDNLIKIEKAYFTSPDIKLRISKLVYNASYSSNSLFLDISELKKESSISFWDITANYKSAKFMLSGFRYYTGNKNTNLFDKGALSSLLLSPKSMLSFNSGYLSYNKDNVLLVKDFHFNPGRKWRIDFDAKIKANILNNRYTSSFGVFGGFVSKDRAEINIIGRKLQENNESYKDFELIGQSKGKDWTIFINRENIALSKLSFDKDQIDYAFEYKTKQASLVSSGIINFKEETINTKSLIFHKDLSTAIIANSFLNNPSGSFKSRLNISGKISDPSIDGTISLNNANFELKNRKDDNESSIRDTNLEVQFNKDKKYITGSTDYNHYMSLSTAYRGGILNIDGYFNLKKWLLDNFDIRVQTFKDMELKLENNFINYDGLLGADFNFYGDYDGVKTINGSVYLKEANLSYIGTEADEQSFFDSINLNVLRVYIMEDVSANIGRGNLSLGELILKKHNTKKNTGSYLVLKKTNETQAISLKGILEAKKGSFDYLGNTFSIVKGSISFETAKKPKVLLKAKTQKIRDENNRTVTVYLTIADELEKLFSTQKSDTNILLNSLSSSPAKSKEEIAILLGYSGTAVADDNNIATTQNPGAGKAADIILNLALVKPIERKLKKIFGIDSFNIKQSILQNALLDDRNKSEYLTAEDKGKEIHFLSNTEITVGKYLSFISDSLFLSGGLKLLQDTHPSREGKLKNVWKVSLEADLLPLIGYDSDTVQINIGAEYQYRQNEISESDRHEGLFKIELLVEF